MDAGKELNLEMVGMYAMESLRLEKCFLGWKSEETVHHNPLETNIDWTVKWNKDFRGKEALQQVKQAGVKQKLVALIVEANDADALGYNAIYHQGRYVGMTSAGGYGHRIDKSIALGYVLPDASEPGTPLEVNILGRNRKAEVAAMPLYDPDNSRMKS